MSKKRVQAFIYDPMDEATITAQLSGVETKWQNVVRQLTTKIEHTFVDVWFENNGEAVAFNTWLKNTFVNQGNGAIYICNNDDKKPAKCKIEGANKWTVAPP